MGHYLNKTGRPILYSCEWPLYMRALGATVFSLATPIVQFGVIRRLSICLYVCLSVCLLATSLKNYRWDFHENFTRDVFVDKEKLIKFGKSYIRLWIRIQDFKESSNRAFFHNLAHISEKKMIGSSGRFITDVS